MGGVTMKVAIASDHGGVNIREEIKSLMDEIGIQYDDFGCECDTSVDYPDFALPVAQKVANGEYDRGILICGTGIGMSIAANKVNGIRCALVHDVFSAKATRQHNDSNMLAMGERVIGPGLAREIALVWLETEFEGGRHANRIGKISDYEKSK
jgi:ribose 5-phosphate isomerase B